MLYWNWIFEDGLNPKINVIFEVVESGFEKEVCSDPRCACVCICAFQKGIGSKR